MERPGSGDDQCCLGVEDQGDPLCVCVCVCVCVFSVGKSRGVLKQLCTVFLSYE